MGKRLLRIKRNIESGSRRSSLWCKTVFLTRKNYVPCDSYRFIWQKVPHVERSFVYYRIFHMIMNLILFAISFLHVSDRPKENFCETEPAVLCLGPYLRMQYEWFFYATNWGLLSNFIQSVWGLVLTLRAYARQKNGQKASKTAQNAKTVGENRQKTSKQDDENWSKQENVQSKEHKILSITGSYWALHSFSICESVLIDVVYWTFIWPPPNYGQYVTFLQLDEHALNLPLMIIDYCVVAFPICLSHIWFTALIPVFYMLVNFIYYLAGGKNSDRTKHYQYSFINWAKPGAAVITGVLAGVAASVLLLIFLVIDHHKFKCRPKNLYNNDTTTRLAS